MKYLRKVILIVLTMLLFTSCYIQNKQEKDGEDMYSIEVLETFFGAGRFENKGHIEYDSLVADKEFATSRLQFPVFQLRSINEGDRLIVYSVYKVSEGGRYYVFWYTDDDLRPKQIKQSYYIRHLADANEFVSIKTGSTLNDVLQIDPSAIIILYSTYTASVSLVNNGTVYKVRYNDEDIVTSVEICNTSDLCFILPDDYPL